VQADEGGTQFDGGAGLDTYDDRNPDGDLDLRLMPTVENASILNGTLHGNDLPNHLESIEFGEIHGHGGDDVLIGGDPEVLSILHGEEGNDTLLGSEAGDSMFGGIGNDVLDGRGGGDTMQGGDGNDTVTYIGRTAGVRVGIGTLADDGEAGEGDNVYLDIETVIGGSGNDTITGGAANNRIVGNGGNDTLRGNYGDDTLVGGSGTDTLNGENGTDTAQDASGDVLVSIENS
jgi:Ca2+-binding RTX toxin-like protein